MTKRSKIKSGIIGIVASALVLALFCLCGITTSPVTPASAETIVIDDVSTAFKRPDNITVDYDKHTLKGEDKSALKVHLGNITHAGEEWKMLVGFTFSYLELQIKWPGAEDEYPRTDGNVVYHDTTITFSDFTASAGFSKYENLEYLDLVSVSDGYDFYFYVPEDGAMFQLYPSGSTDSELIYHPDAAEPWYLTLTAGYSVNGEATETPAMVTLSRIIFTPTLSKAAFEVSENDQYYNSGYEAGFTAGKAEGLAEGKSTGYNEGYDAGYAAGKAAAADNDKPASEDNKPSGNTDKPATDTKADDKTDSSFVVWIKTNKTVLIVSGFLIVGLIVLLCLMSTKPRRRR